MNYLSAEGLPDDRPNVVGGYDWEDYSTAVSVAVKT